ncbi:MAG: DHA2 family efflux MFS transporter permease subunit [Streptomycetaceae bacterium]|nr:MAG: DHA2 family efflux MFS transporter permease subunit [Streptomycetaceae bacterium]
MTSESSVNKHRWLILGIVLAAEIMDLLDSTIVNVAGPSLKDELGATPSALQWVIGGYTLTLGAGLVLGGRLADRYSRRNVFLLGLVSFTITSLLCAIAPNIESLIAFRLIQGFAGAMVLPHVIGFIRDVFPPEELGKAFAVFGPVFGLGGILGPIIGGFLIDGDIASTGWRAVFLVNIPIGVINIALAWKYLPKHATDHSIKIDLFGSLLIMSSSALMLLPLIQGQEAGWPLWTFLSLAASLFGFGIFALQQRWVISRKNTPLVNPEIFKSKIYNLGLAGIFTFFAGFTGVYLIITLFLQIGEGYSARGAGIANIAIALGTAIGGALSGAVLADKFGTRVLQMGACAQIVGALLLFFALPDMQSFDFWHIAPGMLVSGFGTGLVVAALFDAILLAIKDELVGSASGVLSAIQSIASSVGVAIFGTIFFNKVTTGQIDQGFRNALLLQVGLVSVFLVITFLLPKKSMDNTEYAH